MSLKELLGLKRTTYSNRFTYEDLMNAESALGRTLFGPIPAGHQRDFFKNKDNVWIWRDSWVDQVKGPQEIMICYEVRPTGVYKKPLNGGYQKIEGEELDNFRKAAKNYLNLIKTQLYY